MVGVWIRVKKVGDAEVGLCSDKVVRVQIHSICVVMSFCKTLHPLYCVQNVSKISEGHIGCHTSVYAPVAAHLAIFHQCKGCVNDLYIGLVHHIKCREY